MKKNHPGTTEFCKSKHLRNCFGPCLTIGLSGNFGNKKEKAIKLEKEALAQIKETTKENAHLVSNLHSNLGGLYRINGQLALAKSILLTKH